MRAMRPPLNAVAWLALAWGSLRVDGARAAVVCPNTGLASPDVPTLIAAPDTQFAAWILGPDCDKELVYADKYMSMVVSGKGIERVDSVPIVGLRLVGNPLTRGGDFSQATSISLEGFSLSAIGNFILPKYVSLADVSLKSLSGVPLRADSNYLGLSQTQLQSLKGVEALSALTSLHVLTSKLTAIDVSLPPLLEKLALTGSSITKLQRFAFPDSVFSLDLTGNKISVVKGVTWPAKLSILYLEGNPLVEVEIRESDESLFDLLDAFTGDFSQVKCSQPKATLKQINSKNLCVISDELFESLYTTTTAPSPTPRVSSKPTTTTNGSTTSTEGDEASGSTEGDGASASNEEASPSPTSPVPTDSATTTQPTDTAIESSTNGSESSAFPAAESGSQYIDKTTIIETETSSDHTATTVFGVIIGVISVVVAVWFYRVCILAKRRRREDGDKYVSAETPHTATDPNPSIAPSEEYLMNDVRNDKAILPFRIGQKDINLSKQIARGGYGVIYRGTFEGKDVAVKQMLPGTWHDDHALASFMDEIRLCASLDHPKIVAFVGIAYSSLRDLSVVIEFMPGGDLHALLQAQQEQPRLMEDWTRPWTSSQIKCKASIGQDVAEGVAYLHSREPAIIHRDLKARNVLLDLQGNAKLSDFGISRELAIDETMTSEVGTAAWIAPEVLRGARYSEKADVYSLGVLLVELDRCQHPYADEPVLQPNAASMKSRPAENSVSYIAQKNMQIAVLVSTGKLRPAVSNACALEVSLLISQCLSFEPDARPSAAEVAASLGRLVRR